MHSTRSTTQASARNARLRLPPRLSLDTTSLSTSLSTSLRTALTHARLCAQQADQICINKSIDDVLREYTKAAIIASNSEEPPEDMVEWSRQWFVQQNEMQRQLSSQ